MGRKIYLLRHAKPYIEGNERRCLGLTDVPLDAEGKEQARKIRKWIGNQNIREIYSSPLKRCIQTAELLVEDDLEESKNRKCTINIQICEELHEISVGYWENMTFQEIQKCYPKEYEARGREIGYYIIPGGESFHQAGSRFDVCLDKIRKRSTGNILIVSHAGVIRGYLCSLLGISANRVMEIPQPYAGITVLEEDDTVKGASGIKIEKIGWYPKEFIHDQKIQNLYRKYETPLNVIQHMQTVAFYIERLKLEIGGRYEWDLLVKAALVHDIVRVKKNHAKVGATILCREGFEDIADLVRKHNSSESFKSSELTMEELLFYADKRVKEDKIVSIDERFELSQSKCKTHEALEKHRKLYDKAKHIELKMEKLTVGRLDGAYENGRYSWSEDIS